MAQKWLFLALSCNFSSLGSATCESRSRPPPLSFLLKLCVIVLHTHRYHPPKFHPILKYQNGSLTFTHFARAAAYLLLAGAAAAAAAKPGRSTLDTKKGYKTKNGSTSSVTLTLTLTLIKTEYWDRGGGVVPMLLYVLGWRKVYSGLQLGVWGWRLRVACMWLCVLYSPPLFLHWQLAFASSRSHYCMNVTVCFVLPSLLLSLQMAFASPRSHYRTNVTVCFAFPTPFMCLQMAFASPRSHYCMIVTVFFVFPSPFTFLQMAFASPRSHYHRNVTVCFVFPSLFLCLQMAFASPRSHSFSTV